MPTGPLLLSKEIVMSRAYKNGVVDDVNDLSSGADLQNVEQMSGADLAQLLHAARNNSNPTGNGYSKTLGNNQRFSTLAVITADGVNTVTVDTVDSLYVGQVVDIISAAGVSRADNRTITAINPVTKVVTYNGADVSAAVVATDLVATSTLIPNTSLSGADMERFAGDQ